MIPLVEEAKERFQESGVYEACYFCRKTLTKFWHWRTNQPVCKDCAKTHKVAELSKAHPKYKALTKQQYLSKL